MRLEESVNNGGLLSLGLAPGEALTRALDCPNHVFMRGLTSYSAPIGMRQSIKILLYNIF